MATIKNKVVFNGEVLIDISNDTVTESDVRKGVTFHTADGQQKVGTMETMAKLPAISLGAKTDGTTKQSISTSITKLNIGTTISVNTDATNEYFSVSSGQVNCLKKGVVLVLASAYQSHGSTAGYGSLHIYKNGLEVSAVREYCQASTTASMNCSVIMDVNANDYFDIRGRANVSSNYYTENPATFLDVIYLS